MIEGVEKLRSKEVELAENSVGDKTKNWHEGGEIEEAEENQQQRMKEDKTYLFFARTRSQAQTLSPIPDPSVGIQTTQALSFYSHLIDFRLESLSE